MNLLLDTHTLIWFAENSNELSLKAKNEIENPANIIHISIVSFWEIGIKISLNKLIMKQSFDKFIKLVNSYNFILIPILLTIHWVLATFIFIIKTHLTDY